MATRSLRWSMELFTAFKRLTLLKVLRRNFSTNWPTAKRPNLSLRFPYDAKQWPTLPLTLRANGLTHEALAVVDSGADVNVLPWSLGQRLGLVWSPNKATIRVAGISQGAAMPVLLKVDVGEMRDITLAFAWCQTDAVPLVLGQTNFFMEFDICFFKSKGEFQVERKRVPS